MRSSEAARRRDSEDGLLTLEQHVVDVQEEGIMRVESGRVHSAMKALTTAQFAALSTAQIAAIESADVAFTGHDLRLIPQALQHARRGSRIINQNIVLSLAIIIVLMPLAISGVLGLAAVVLVHEVAEVIEILNGLRAAQAKR